MASLETAGAYGGLARSALALDFLSPPLGFVVADTNSGPLRWTRDAGTDLERAPGGAAPFTLPR